MKNKDSKKGLIITLILLILVILGLVFYICYDKGIVLNTNKENKKDVSNKIKKSKDSTNNNDSTKNDKMLDFSKCINCSDRDDVNYTITSMDHIAEVKAFYSNDTTIGTMYIDINAYNKKAVSNYVSPTNEYEYHFNKAIKDVLVYNIGQEELCPIVMYLMEDGTINYIDICNSLENGDLSSYKTIPNIDGITKLYSAAGGSQYGISTVLAKKSDGSFYDLGYGLGMLNLNK